MKRLTPAEAAQLAAIPAEVFERLRRVLARTFRGIHHCTGWAARRPFDNGISVTHYGGISTFDYDQLTRLVIAAHDECVRVDVAGVSNGYLRIGLTPRVREGQVYFRHDTIEAAIAKARPPQLTQQEEKPMADDKTDPEAAAVDADAAAAAQTENQADGAAAGDEKGKEG